MLFVIKELINTDDSLAHAIIGWVQMLRIHGIIMHGVAKSHSISLSNASLISINYYTNLWIVALLSIMCIHY